MQAITVNENYVNLLKTWSETFVKSHQVLMSIGSIFGWIKVFSMSPDHAQYLESWESWSWIWIIQKYCDFVITPIHKIHRETWKGLQWTNLGRIFAALNQCAARLRQQLSTLEKYRTIFARHDGCNPRQNCPIYSYKYMPRCHIQPLFMLKLQ